MELIYLTKKSKSPKKEGKTVRVSAETKRILEFLHNQTQLNCGEIVDTIIQRAYPSVRW